jgi:hypothetical protein
MPDWLDNIGAAVGKAGASELNKALNGDQALTDAKRGEDVTSAKSADKKINYLIFAGIGVAILILAVVLMRKR